MRRTGMFRVWAVLWAVLQFALPGAATLADARIERESALSPGSHVESTTSATCRPSHPDECALCQFLSRVAPPPPSGALPAIASDVQPSAVGALPGLATRALARVSLPRAPPAALA